jgi:TDG/mug DNA glycosylase family protein
MGAVILSLRPITLAPESTTRRETVVASATDHHRPSPGELAAAAGRSIPDVVCPGLTVLFCGINPGLWSAAVGHHFARPGNRFWKVLHASGFCPSMLDASEDSRLLALGLGITNLVSRATATASELRPEELKRGARRLTRNAARWKPKVVAVVGMTSYRVAFSRPQAKIGPQPHDIAASALWLLPNPSGLQATYQLTDLVAAFRELRESTD